MSGAVTVGQLRIDLKANTASFSSDMAKASDTAKKSAGEMQSEFNKINFHEARGATALLSEELGLHLPRHVTAFLSTLPGVGIAMTAAFAPLAIIVLGTKIFEAVEHINKFKEKLTESANAYVDLALGVQRHAAAIEVDNLKLRDQLAILNGAMQKNELSIALEESRVKAEELTAQIQKAIKEEKKLLGEQSVNFWKSLLGDTQTSDIVDFVTAGKEAIAELERQKGVALVAHEDATVASIQKELDEKRRALQTELETRRKAEDTARVTKIAADVAAQKEIRASYTQGMNPQQKAAAELSYDQHSADNEKSINAEVATRARLYDTAILELKAENREEKDLLENAGLRLDIAKKKHDLEAVDMSKQTGGGKLGMQGSFDANGKYLDAEATRKQAADKLDLAAADALGKAHLFDLGELTKITDEHEKQQKLADQMAANASAAALADDIHKIKMQEASGVITKIQADQQIIVKITESEAKAEKDKNAELTKQLALITQLATVTNGGTTGSDADKKAYSKAIADYQAFLLTKEKAKATSDAKLHKTEEDAAARTWAIQLRSIQAVQNLLNTGVQSWISGQETFAQAAQQAWSNFATTAVMSLVKVSEQEMIAHFLHKAIKEDEKVLYAKSIYWKVYDALADIPIVGPVLAPVAGAAAFATVMAFEKGGEVPDGFGATHAMLHPREMVLNADLADVVRGAAANNHGGGNGHGSRPISMTTHISALAASADEITKVLEPHIKKVLRSEARNRYVRF